VLLGVCVGAILPWASADPAQVTASLALQPSPDPRIDHHVDLIHAESAF